MIKPELFDDPDIGELEMVARWLFAGLLTQADKRGRLVDEPRRLKARLLPFDRTVDIDKVLADLATARMILRYEHGGKAYIQIRSFEKHQRPHPKEAESAIPAPHDKADTKTSRETATHGGVYGVIVGDKIKIGYSRSLGIRTNTIIKSLPGAKLEWIVEGLTGSQARQMERLIHKSLWRHHVDSEWFTVNEHTLNPVLEEGRVITRLGQTKGVASKSESGVLILDSGTRNLERKDKAAAAPRPSDPRSEPPTENLRIITKLAHEAIDIEGIGATLSDLADAVKSLCSTRAISYNSDVVRKAVDSALAQRRVKAS